MMHGCADYYDHVAEGKQPSVWDNIVKADLQRQSFQTMDKDGKQMIRLYALEGLQSSPHMQLTHNGSCSPCVVKKFRGTLQVTASSVQTT